jgi:hypothetical protein
MAKNDIVLLDGIVEQRVAEGLPSNQVNEVRQSSFGEVGGSRQDAYVLMAPLSRRYQRVLGKWTRQTASKSRSTMPYPT